MSQAIPRDRVFERPAWKTTLNWIAAVLVGVLFLASGIWKISDPIGWSILIHQLRAPQITALPLAVILGTLETVAGALFLIPGYRKLAAWLGGALLVIFMLYIGANYSALHGADCSCFPFVKRAVDPAFFVEDAAMLLLAWISGAWAGAQSRMRGAWIILGAVAVFSLVSLGVAEYRQTGSPAPATLTVEGKPYDISHGRVLVFFFDPECMHCLDAAERMSKMTWNDTQIVGVPVVRPQFAPAFLERTRLQAHTSTDFAVIKDVFNYKAYPYAVAVENGRQIAALTQFDENEPAATLRRLHFAN